MRQLLLSLSVIMGTVLCLRTDLAQAQDEAQPPAVDLDDVLRHHELQMAKLKSAVASWSVAYQNPNQDPTTEKFSTTIADPFQGTVRWLSNGSPTYSWRDDTEFVRISNYDPAAITDPETAARRARVTRYQSEQSLMQLFNWRSLRAYRFFANDVDMSFRELIEQSSIDPIVTQQDELIRVEVGHPGAPANKAIGAPGIPRGTPVKIEFDTRHGYTVKRHETAYTMQQPDPESGENIPTEFTQALEIQDYEEAQNGLFLPSKVQYAAMSKGQPMMEQEIAFEFSNVNEPVDTAKSRYLPGMLVAEFGGDDQRQIVGHYVVDDSGSLGPRYASDSIARAMQLHRFGEISDETLESQLTTLRSAPGVTSQAPPVHGEGILTGHDEKIAFEGRVTVLEFWSTTCGPCQGAMAHINEFAAEMNKEWKDKIQFVSVSLDTDQEAASKRLTEQDWVHTLAIIDQPLSDGTSPDGTSPIAPGPSVYYPARVASEYVVTAIPTCLIIDHSGKIAYRGHFLNEDATSLIDRLLAKNDD